MCFFSNSKGVNKTLRLSAFETIFPQHIRQLSVRGVPFSVLAPRAMACKLRGHHRQIAWSGHRAARGNGNDVRARDVNARLERGMKQQQARACAWGAVCIKHASDWRGELESEDAGKLHGASHPCRCLELRSIHANARAWQLDDARWWRWW